MSLLGNKSKILILGVQENPQKLNAVKIKVSRLILTPFINEETIHKLNVCLFNHTLYLDV